MRRTPASKSAPPAPLRRFASATTLAVLTACAAVPLQPDMGARAPELAGFGRSEIDITTASPEARRWFNAGVLQAYAFNEKEAIRMFKAALAQDPRCAMCAWGVAWQLGPIINAPDRGTSVAEAERYADLAVRNVAGTTAREQALIALMAFRYGHASQQRETAPLMAERCAPGAGGEERAHPLDVAYAERLRAMTDAAPGDAELLTLYAEAEMVATRGDWWDAATGRPAGRIGELADRLEAAAKLYPGHTGINHYMVHATDAPTVAQRAEAAADRLGALAPASPHLVHMPSHTYLQVGRYADATRVNEQAMAAEQGLFDEQKRQGFSISKDWRNHDQDFLSYGALMEGRGDVALAAARDLASRAISDNPFAELRRSRPALVLLRLQRWQALADEPLPIGEKGMAKLVAGHARGVALARLGRVAEAQAQLVNVEAALARVTPIFGDAKGFERKMLDALQATPERLKAEIALAQGRTAEAVALQAGALKLAEPLETGDPPLLGGGVRLALADMQRQAGMAAAAEANYRAEMLGAPHSGWALHGLVLAVQAQGRDPGALRAQAVQAWPRADASLLALR